MSAALAGIAVLLTFAAIWELAGSAHGRAAPLVTAMLGRLTGGRARSVVEAAERLGLSARIERAGLSGTLDPRAAIAAKLAIGLTGAAIGIAVAPLLAPRLALTASGALAVAGFLAPDAALERRAARRRRAFVGALPDALDMLAVGAAAGRDAAGGMAAIVRAGSPGTLTAELARTVAEVECGRPMRAATASLRRRVPGAEIAALAAALERSRVYGSPLADQLYAQATELRRAQRRRIEDRAARAAPKIQLVVALVLVPSVLLTLVAAIVAHSDALLGQF
jgi:tight adherence protein C